MGANHSHENQDLSDSESDSESHSQSDSEASSYGTPSSNSDHKIKSPSSIDDIESRLKALKLKYNNNAVKLFRFVNGETGKSKWVNSEKLVPYSFIKTSEEGNDEEEEDDEEERSDSVWVLRIGLKVRVKIDENMQLKVIKNQKRVDFVAGGVWAAKFFDDHEYEAFIKKYQDCLFENTFKYEANDDNKVKVYGKDFIGWANPEAADDSMWEDESPVKEKRREYGIQDLTEEFEEAAATGSGAIQSLALGALDNSFLVSDSGIQVVKNFNHGIQGKGGYVNFNDGRLLTNCTYSTPRKALLMKAETNMLLMSPANEGNPHARGLHQFDIEAGRIVSEWKFGKDGVDIAMRDITNDNKGAQMDPSGSTFLGLDDNRLCRWDMRDRKGMVQNVVDESTPVLNWTQGHQFSRGTNFQCFATTGDGSIVVGSLDGKIRLYSVSSMRMAKTAFPGLGSPITHVDVTYDGKWILGTTDAYLILICSLFTDKDGNTKTGFTGRMGNKISAPRLLKLNPVDSHMAGASNKFRNAQFSWVTENGRQERHLVATVGKFSVIWNFQKVKDGSHECYQNQVGLKSCYCYKVVLKEDSIVDSRFMHEKYAVSDSPEAPLVVATNAKFSSISMSSSRLRM